MQVKAKKKREEKKPQKAMDAGARGRRLLQRREYRAKVSEFIPKELEDHVVYEGDPNTNLFPAGTQQKVKKVLDAGSNFMKNNRVGRVLGRVFGSSRPGSNYTPGGKVTAEANSAQMKAMHDAQMKKKEDDKVASKKKDVKEGSAYGITRGSGKPSGAFKDYLDKKKKEKKKVEEGKEEGGYISNAAKAEVRNQRRFGKKGSAEPTGRFGQGTSEKAKLAVKRGEEHKARRGVKTKGMGEELISSKDMINELSMKKDKKVPLGRKSNPYGKRAIAKMIIKSIAEPARRKAGVTKEETHLEDSRLTSSNDMQSKMYADKNKSGKKMSDDEIKKEKGGKEFLARLKAAKGKMKKEGTSYGLYKGDGKPKGPMAKFGEKKKKEKKIEEKVNLKDKSSQYARGTKEVDTAMTDHVNRTRGKHFGKDGRVTDVGRYRRPSKREARKELEDLYKKESKSFSNFQQECWKTHKKVGMKMKGGKLVNDCRPKNEEAKIDEGAAWTKKAGKSESGGLNEKGRKSYERENPGSDLKAPSKKVGNKRRTSFCARMKGMRKRQKPSNNTGDDRLSKSLRKWNC